MCAGPPGTASPATAELYLFRKLLSPCPDGSRSNARARRDLAHWADQGPARKQALLSSLAFPAIITIIVGMSGGRTNIFRSSGSKAGLDRMDVTILGLLQNNARLSVKEIAAEVALAPSSTDERIKRIARFRVLRGTHAEVDPKAFGVGLEGLFMIELSKHKRGTVDRFIDDIAGVPEVRFAFLVTGRYDVVVHVVVRDTQHLKDLALDQFTSRPGVTRFETSIILRLAAATNCPSSKWKIEGR